MISALTLFSVNFSRELAFNDESLQISALSAQESQEVL